MVLGAIRVEDLAVFGSDDDLRVSLSQEFEERYLAGAEEELGLSVENVYSEVPVLEILDQLHRLVLNFALCWVDVELDRYDILLDVRLLHFMDIRNASKKLHDQNWFTEMHFIECVSNMFARGGHLC